MVSRLLRFNSNLLLLLLVLAVAGCKTSPETKRKRQLATARVYLEVGPGFPGQNQKISVLRTAPLTLEVEKGPFLNELHVAAAQIVDTPAGFTLSLRLNQKGAWLLEQYTAANPNRHLAIRCQWGVAPDVQDRWVAAPLITHRIKDGILAFTPDASRDEAEQIVIGLNNYAGDTLLKEKSAAPESAGGQP